jgi:uncharacterized C2H2 Zn-finger protein
MSELCRLCLSNADELHSLFETHENLPISVICMIICPIKIEVDDSLSKFICGQCLQTICNAYNLRSISLNSERLLKEVQTVENIRLDEIQDVIQDADIDDDKQDQQNDVDDDQDEEFTSDNYVVYEPQESQEDDQSSNTKGTQIIEFKKDPNFPYHVDCDEGSENKKSIVWNYFGNLKENGSLVETEKNYYFCKICVERTQSLKPKYKIESIATSVLFFHLERVHGLTKAELKEIIPNNNQVNELTTCKICCKNVHTTSLSLHNEIEHENGELSRNREKISDYRVDCFKNSKKSLAWDYFGLLLDKNSQLVDEYHFYCRLCVEESGQLNPKYAKNTSTSILLLHLNKSHTTNVGKYKKRKISYPIDFSEPEVSKKEQFTCKNCSEVFDNRKSLNRHLSKNHGEDQPKNFTCDYEGCNKSFTLRDTLSKHIKQSHQGGDKFPCDRCPTVLSTKMSLTRHINACHLKLKQYYCEICKAAFTELKSLKNHARKIHMGIDDKNIECDLCELKFPNQWSLKRHQLTHTKEVRKQ